MKVGILTINGFNYGSFLQAFALKKLIEELGHDAYIINTITLKELLNFRSSFFIFEIKRIFSLLSSWKNLKTSCFKYFDIIVIGSDIVWDASKKEDRFFGYKLPTNKIVTYAPCCSDTTYEDLNNLQIKSMRGISHFSARDDKTMDMIEKVTGKKCTLVLDPTFLIDWSKYEQIIDFDNFILVYSYKGNNRQMIIKAMDLSKKTGKKLVSVGSHIPWCDVCVSDISPFEFLGFVKKADYVVTDTFHGTIFSLIYKKHFVPFPHIHKVEYLLDSFGIEQNFLFKDYKKINYEKRKKTSKKYLSELFK